MKPLLQTEMLCKNDLDHRVLAIQVRDYAEVGLRLFWQRLIIFSAAIGMQAFYYSLNAALLTIVLIIISETYDHLTFTNAIKQEGPTLASLKRRVRMFQFGTALSATVIGYFTLSIASYQGTDSHFMPLFFLFAAAIFSAMHNHQIISLLTMRLIIYGSIFLFIPARDIWLEGASIKSELWI